MGAATGTSGRMVKMKTMATHIGSRKKQVIVEDGDLRFATKQPIVAADDLVLTGLLHTGYRVTDIDLELFPVTNARRAVNIDSKEI